MIGVSGPISDSQSLNTLGPVVVGWFLWVSVSFVFLSDSTLGSCATLPLGSCATVVYCATVDLAFWVLLYSISFFSAFLFSSPSQSMALSLSCNQYSWPLLGSAFSVVGRRIL